MVECGLLKSKILDIKESIEEKGIHYSLLLSRSLETTAINHFLYHQSHLYPKKVGYSSMRLLEVTTKLRLLSTEGEDLLKEPIESQKKTYKGTGSDNATEFLKHNIKRHVELALLILDSLEKSLGDKFPKTQDFDQTIQEFKS